MSLSPSVAERLLTARLGEPLKAPSQYVVGFATTEGKILAIHRTIAETMVWFRPPAPPGLNGVELQTEPNNGNSNLNGPLKALQASDTLRVRIDDESALHRFLDWYGAKNGKTSSGSNVPKAKAFSTAFAEFLKLTEKKFGEPFRSFHEGGIAVWESYKLRLRQAALSKLQAESWVATEIGTGSILERVIDAIEIQDSSQNLTNNLVFWQNRYGHANRDHRALLDAQTDRTLCREVEAACFDLFKGRPGRENFERLNEFCGGKYPLIAYLYFLQDDARFMPIQPTGCDRAFEALGVDFKTLRNCSWENYQTYNSILNELRGNIASAAGLSNVRLVDVHSFCWVYATLLKQAASGELERKTLGPGSGKILGGRETSIKDMIYSIKHTVRNSNGQTVERRVKDKNLELSEKDLAKLLERLLDVQENRCALTGMAFSFPGPETDKWLQPSPDRIDSDGHYSAGNIQIVCRFINFWKSDMKDSEFRRLLRIVQEHQNAGDVLPLSGRSEPDE